MLTHAALVCVFLLTGRIEASPARTQRMTVTKMRAEDLESSASGYVYNQQQGLPVYYLHYTDHGSGSYYRAPHTVHYTDAPVARTPILQPYAAMDKRSHQEIVAYGGRELPKHAAASAESQPRAPYYTENVVEPERSEDDKTRDTEANDDDSDKSCDKDDGDIHGDENDDSDEDSQGDNGHSSESDTSDGDGDGRNEFYGSHNDESGESEGSHGGDSSSAAENGEQYESSEFSKHGETGENGSQSHHEFSKGDRGTDEEERHKGHYSKNGGQRNGHINEQGKHGSHDEAEKGHEGSNYEHSTYHKKGEKTNGFHNVYHKDEYKKETDFYDDYHKKGYFDKFDEFDKGYKAFEGGSQNGGHHSSDYDQDASGKKGAYDKGVEKSQDQGHELVEGEKSYHLHHENYASKENSKSAKEDNFHNDSGHH